MQKIIQYFKEVRQEMGKVSWPSREEIIGGTNLVIILSLAFALVVKVYDLALSKVLGWVIKL